MQVLSILTMERPVSFAAEDIRDEKVRVTRACGVTQRSYQAFSCEIIGQGP